MKQLVFILVGLLIATGMANATAKEKKAAISVNKTTHDFGTIYEKDGKVSCTFVLQNTGKAPLLITKVITLCGCTTSEWPKQPIAPGKKADLKITYDPMGRSGKIMRTISIRSNASDEDLILSIKGKVIDFKTEEAQKAKDAAQKEK